MERKCLKCDASISATSNGFCKEHKPGFKATSGINEEFLKYKPLLSVVEDKFIREKFKLSKVPTISKSYKYKVAVPKTSS